MQARKYSYRRTLPHILKDNHPVFVTFATYKRWIIPAEIRKTILDACLAQHRRSIDWHAVVVMPYHVHLIFAVLVDKEGWPYTLPDILHTIKGRTAWMINRALSRTGPVWQDECFDHVLRSTESLCEKVDYALMNPVRAGLVSRPGEYPWMWKGEIPAI